MTTTTRPRALLVATLAVLLSASTSAGAASDVLEAPPSVEVDGSTHRSASAPGTSITWCDDLELGQVAYVDLTATQHHARSVRCLDHLGVISGFPDGRFGPGDQVTRAQAATILIRGLTAIGVDPVRPAAQFPDVAESSAHFSGVGQALDRGIVAGRSHEVFDPGGLVTRAEFAAMLSRTGRFLRVDSDAKSTTVLDDVHQSTHVDDIREAVSNGWVTGYGDRTFRPEVTITRAQVASMVSRLLGDALARPEFDLIGRAVDHEVLFGNLCPTQSRDVAIADDILDGYVHLRPHDRAHVGTHFTWDEDPFGQHNWEFQFHALRWLLPLISSHGITGDDRYLDHALAVSRSWLESNPLADPPSDFSWNDHSAAWRARVLTCLWLQLDPDLRPDWLEQGMRLHALMLEDDAFYVHRGNHALNQDIGLMTIACVLEDWDRVTLAQERIERLALASIDEHGVNNEQAVEYQAYNYVQYGAARDLSRSCRPRANAWVGRLAMMPTVLAHMIQPDGNYAPIGDTDRKPPHGAIVHPQVRWVATGGQEGQPPDATFASYDTGGYTFSRSGWGEQRPAIEENFLSVRHGPATTMHGHFDHGSVLLFSQGQTIIADPGKFAYGNDPFRDFVLSPEAQNVVVFDGNCRAGQGDSRLIVARQGEEIDRVVIDVGVCSGASWRRELVFLKNTGHLIVIDHVESPDHDIVGQHFNLEVGARITRNDERTLVADWERGASVRLDALSGTSRIDVAFGQTDPVRGWISERYAQMTPTHSVLLEPTASGCNEYITVISPSGRGTEAARSPELVTGSDGASSLRIDTGPTGWVSVDVPQGPCG